MEKNNIQTRPIFSGNILRHPAFKILKSSKNKLSSFKNSDFVMKNGLLIGCHQGLNHKKIKYIHDKFKKFLKNMHNKKVSDLVAEYLKEKNKTRLWNNRFSKLTFIRLYKSTELHKNSMYAS